MLSKRIWILTSENRSVKGAWRQFSRKPVKRTNEDHPSARDFPCWVYVSGFLHCFDTAGWLTGRTHGLWNVHNYYSQICCLSQQVGEVRNAGTAGKCPLNGVFLCFITWTFCPTSNIPCCKVHHHSLIIFQCYSVVTNSYTKTITLTVDGTICITLA